MSYDWEADIRERLSRGKPLPTGFRIVAYAVENTNTGQGALVRSGYVSPTPDLPEADVWRDISYDAENAYLNVAKKVFPRRLDAGNITRIKDES